MGTFAEGLVGITLDDRYRLDAVLGEGGMGAVFRATQLAMDRKVAVKLLKPHLASDETALHRFAREARNALKVDSEHAVKVVDYGVTPMNDYYMVLEYLDGRTVQRELEVDGVFTPQRAVHVARQVLHALGAAHRIGLIHRDIKPDNLLLLKQGDDPDYTKVLDFGVSKLMEGAAVSTQSQLKLTQAGVVFGTPEFMSPEQACGHALDGRSDLYSLAATLFSMLTGRALFEAGSPIELLTQHVRAPAPHLPDELPKKLDAILQKCLEKRPDLRYADAAELDAALARLEPLLRGEAPPSASHPKVAMFSPSGYVEAIADPLTDDVPPVRRRRGMYLAIGGLAAAAMVAVAIGVATSKKKPVDTPIDAAPRVAIAPPPDAAPPPPVDAAAPPPVDAAAPIPHVPHGSAAPPPHPPASDLAQRLADYDAAKKSGNVLKQLAAAQLAVKADPRSARARLAFAEALIAAQNKDEGCQQLRAMVGNASALAMAHAAGCD